MAVAIIVADGLNGAFDTEDIFGNMNNTYDTVNNPRHYSTGKFECIEVMEEALGTEAVKGFCLCNAFKYIYRCRNKNGIEDIKKADWYLKKLIEIEERNE